MKANGFKSMASSLQNEVDVADVLNEPRMLKTPICQTLIDVIFRTEKPNNTLTIDVLITIDTLRAPILTPRESRDTWEINQGGGLSPLETNHTDNPYLHQPILTIRPSVARSSLGAKGSAPLNTRQFCLYCVQVASFDHFC